MSASDSRGEEMSPGQVTELLVAARDGDRTAFDRLLPAVYGELRRLARRQLGRERQGHTLLATDLAHEAYLKLVDQARVEWQGRAHFFAVAARAMRQVLIDYARKRSTDKRGGDAVRTTLGDRAFAAEYSPEQLLALDQALDRLAELDERLPRVVEMRFFAGLKEQEIAEVLGTSERTIQRDWARARAWLYKELYPESSSP
jgi:RNA polymerase sigma factor (TIGR02999 family)